jgi:hypothetical protein
MIKTNEVNEPKSIEIGEKMAKIIVLNYSGFIGSIHQRSDQSSL